MDATVNNIYRWMDGIVNGLTLRPKLAFDESGQRIEGHGLTISACE